MCRFVLLKDMAELASYNQKKLQPVGEMEDELDLVGSKLSGIDHARLAFHVIFPQSLIVEFNIVLEEYKCKVRTSGTISTLEPQS